MTIKKASLIFSKWVIASSLSMLIMAYLLWFFVAPNLYLDTISFLIIGIYLGFILGFIELILTWILDNGKT